MKQNIYENGKIFIDCEIPYPGKYDVSKDTGSDYRKPFGDWEIHIRNLTSYPYAGTNLVDGAVLVEGKDYYLKFEYSEYPAKVIAIPKEQPVNSIISGGEESQGMLIDNICDALESWVDCFLDHDSCHTRNKAEQHKKLIDLYKKGKSPDDTGSASQG